MSFYLGLLDDESARRYYDDGAPPAVEGLGRGDEVDPRAGSAGSDGGGGGAECAAGAVSKRRL